MLLIIVVVVVVLLRFLAYRSVLLATFLPPELRRHRERFCYPACVLEVIRTRYPNRTGDAYSGFCFTSADEDHFWNDLLTMTAAAEQRVPTNDVIMPSTSSIAVTSNDPLYEEETQEEVDAARVLLKGDPNDSSASEYEHAFDEPEQSDVESEVGSDDPNELEALAVAAFPE